MSRLRWLTAGESHGPALVATLEGLPAGVPITTELVADALARRRLGYGRGARMKFEQDEITFLGGVRHGLSLGSPVAVMVGNTEWPKWEQVMAADPVDAEELAALARNAPLTRPRPGESQGRIHTSAAGVLVMPEAEQVDVTIDDNDLRIDVFRSSGPGGQSVNTTDSAVRITHIPTGIVVSCQNEKSQLQNREQAMRVLRSRLLAMAQEQADAEAADVRRSQVRTVDRSERIRTYNFPENRITDHRVGFKAHNLDAVLDGDLQAVIDALVDADLADRLAAVEGSA